MGDLTDVLGRLQALEKKFDKVFGLMDELMRDQTEIEKRLEKLEQRGMLRKGVISVQMDRNRKHHEIEKRLEKLEKGSVE